MRLPRQSLFGAVLAAHLLLIVLIARWQAAVTPPPVGERALLIAQLPRPAPPPAPPSRPRLKLPVVLPPEPAPDPPPPPAAAPDLSGCAIAPAMQAVVEQDVKVRTALAAIPADARSVANTIMLWDGAWMDAAAPGPLDPVRTAFGVVLSEQPAECLDQPVVGPQLFVVTNTLSSISLVIGSGRWRWADLLAASDSQEHPPLQASIGSHRAD